MRRYESYKDSGVEWLGKIPSHWDLTIGMNVFRENKRDNKGMKEKTVLSLSYGQIIIKPEEKLVGLVPESFETYQIVEPNDIIIRCTDLQNDQTSLRTGLAKDKGIITSAYLNLKVINNHSAKFLHYYLHALDITKVLYKFGSGLRQNLSFLDFKRLPIIDISLSEQQKIAQFLDEKTAKIDQAVDLAEKQIALLKEHKQILIQNAVTRGLNPDVPLKDSGVEWIGQAPEHWEVVSMKRVVKEHSGNGFPIDLQGNNGNIPFLKVSDFSENKDKYIFKWNNSVTNKVIKQKKWNIVPKNSIVTAKIGEALRKNHRKILSIDSIIDNNCLGIEIKKADVLFGYYLHCALDFDLFTNPGAIPSLAMDKYRNQKIVLPPFQEQQEIADYLEQQIAKINQAIALKTAHIEKLKEYKSVLINDVVTGKVRV